MRLNKTFGLIAGVIFLSQSAHSFCGFFVAKSNGKLFNKTSQVVLARDGNRTTITMSQDYVGDIKDFAMVIPVPEILGRSDIKTVPQSYINRLDEYSAPRIAEYYDESPCQIRQNYMTGAVLRGAQQSNMRGGSGATERSYGVTIEAEYEVDEYDILILSATESDGLKDWLNDNEYKIPESANEVLDPYIKDGMKFFVAKVSLERIPEGGAELTPLQISFNSPKFMLPIRLGMANSEGEQNMQVFLLSKNGRVEPTNYRTQKMTTDVNIPEFVSYELDDFYKRLFNKAYEAVEGKAVFLEYAWDISSTNSIKCDPCVTIPVAVNDVDKFGVNWDARNIFFTRLRVRYNRKNFPQDLQFQVTTNKEKFQCRYVVHRTSSGPFNCSGATSYFQKVIDRRNKELATLKSITGQTLADFPVYDDYVTRWERKLKSTKKNEIIPVVTPKNNPTNPGNGMTILLYSLIGLSLFGAGWKFGRIKNNSAIA